MDDSILNTIKKLLGLPEDINDFDQDVIIGINTTFGILAQIGVGPSTGFLITDDSSTWNDYIPEGKNLEMIKTYVYMKTKMQFDPPQSSAVSEAMNKILAETEWRIASEVNYPVKDEE